MPTNEAGQECKEVSFTVPLSGSYLFDTNQFILAKNICDKFPSLHFIYEKERITITGLLNEFWEEQFNKMLFQRMGSIE